MDVEIQTEGEESTEGQRIDYGGSALTDCKIIRCHLGLSEDTR